MIFPAPLIQSLRTVRLDRASVRTEFSARLATNPVNRAELLRAAKLLVEVERAAEGVVIASEEGAHE